MRKDKVPKREDSLPKAISDIVKQKKSLPANMEDLISLSFIGQSSVSLYREKLRLIDNLAVTEEQRKAALAKGQQVGELLLDIEARIGELLPEPAEAQQAGRKHGGKARHGVESSSLGRPKELTAEHAYQARLIKDNPAIVESAKARARAHEEIVTRTAVVKAIEASRAKGQISETDWDNLPKEFYDMSDGDITCIAWLTGDVEKKGESQ